jgi:hypothetical protein
MTERQIHLEAHRRGWSKISTSIFPSSNHYENHYYCFANSPRSNSRVIGRGPTWKAAWEAALQSERRNINDPVGSWRQSQTATLHECDNAWRQQA